MIFSGILSADDQFEHQGAARAGYFFFSNSDARKIYDQGAPTLELEYKYWFLPRYAVWTNLNVIWASGKTKALSSTSHITMTTTSVGVQEFFPCRRGRLKPYVGFGMTIAYVRTKDHTDYLPQTTVRWSLGCVGKLGALFLFSERIFGDFFFDYYYQPTRTRKSGSFSDDFIDLGGGRIGWATGYRF